MEKLTIAGSSGAVWLSLVTHFAFGLLALASGFVALVVAKGGQVHKKSGMVFTISMILMGLMASGIAAYAGKDGFVTSGLFTGYLVFTGLTAVKPIAGNTRRADVILMLVAFGLAIKQLWGGVLVWQQPGHVFQGVPAVMIFFMGTVTLLAGLGDLRMIRDGAIEGSRRLARHLWRMCFAFYIATGSFFIGQMKFLPEPIRILPLMFLLGFAPLIVMIYWMWRVRLRKQLRGLILAQPTRRQAA